METPSPRPRGRPPRIDRDAALAKALDVFWDRGFDAASLDDLTDAMGLSRPALYAAFGDKRALFDRALKLYAQTQGEAALTAFEAAPDIEAAVRAFLTVSVDSATQADRPAGCFIACSATQGAPAHAVREALVAGNETLKTRLMRRFERAVEKGALRPRPTPEARLGLMLDMRNALSFRARTGDARGALIADIPDRVAAVLRADA